MPLHKNRNSAVALQKERHRLASKLVHRFRAHFDKHGIEAIERLYAESPAAYFKVAASLLPKSVEVEVKPEASYQDALQSLSQELHANTGMRLDAAVKAAEEHDARDEPELDPGHYPALEDEARDILS